MGFMVIVIGLMVMVRPIGLWRGIWAFGDSEGN